MRRKTNRVFSKVAQGYAVVCSRSTTAFQAAEGFQTGEWMMCNGCHVAKYTVAGVVCCLLQVVALLQSSTSSPTCGCGPKQVVLLLL